ncbi:MAG TPA: hypothetical protein PKM25_18535, partial [Candidatus Ozemobacteraceae bacterium]|nr:hypothetical protein [Candidatus Ozemobacteraceae bacterium]
MHSVTEISGKAGAGDAAAADSLQSDDLLSEVRREINATLRPAFLAGAVFGIVSGVVMAAAGRAGLVPHMTIPALWAILCGVSVLL